MIRTVLAGGLLAMAGAAFGACPPVFQSSGNATLYTPGTLLACSVPVDPLDTMVTALAPDHPFTLTTRPTSIQHHAFQLLSLPACTQ